MRTNVLLSLLALGLAVMAYAERSHVPASHAGSERRESGEPLFALQPEEINAIRVLDQRGCVLVRKKGGQPLPEDLLDVVTQAHVTRRFVPATTDLSPYGLAQPARRVDVWWGAAPQVHTVVLGSRNPVGDAVYAQVAETPDILLVGGYFVTALDFALQRLRAEGKGDSVSACSAGFTGSASQEQDGANEF